ncbi:MAG: hypothetical protein SWK90_17140 [Chloroflexota bacterium]|nr:hypothetical protein [Chloroflexota bacterium]
MSPRQEITVHRAKINDAGKIAAFINRARSGQPEINEQAVIVRFRNVGFLLAEQDGNLVGMLGWRIENLIVQVSDFMVWPAQDRFAVGQALFSEMERAATELQCEVALLSLPGPRPPDLIKFCETFGYVLKTVTNLPKAWREAAHEARIGDDESILMKQLRSNHVRRPL